MLSKKESAVLMHLIRATWPEVIIPKIKTFKVYQIEEGKFLLQAESFFAIQTRESVILPFLGKPELIDHFPSVYVDMGAIKFVCNGAKVMRPGITSFDTFKKDGIVIVKDQTYKKALAVGIALVDSEIASSMTTGYVIDNLHYVSDKFWEASKSIAP
ncbi:MAG: PUA domain-containing protein [Candidatus Nitrosopolaris sp.]